MIIGITGKKQSGKTTSANHLVLQGFMKASFAETLKCMALVLLTDLGVRYEDQLNYEKNKEVIVPETGVSFRSLIQSLGTEWGRDTISRDLWVKTTEVRLNRVTGHSGVVFDDVRFEEEAHWIRAKGGTVIHLLRHSDSEDNHVSEAGIKFHASDKLIRNEGSVATLLENLEYIIYDTVRN